MRASDAERTATVEMLQHAVGHGQLTPDEGGERMATAFGARYRDELPAITADLPPVASGPGAPVGWRTLAAGLVGQLQHELRATRAAGVRSRRFVVAVVTVVLVALLVALVAHGAWAGGPGDGFHGDGFHGDGGRGFRGDGF